MLIVLLTSFALALLTCFGLIASAHRHAAWSADHDLDGPQKMHQHVVPRIGGVGIAAGLLVSLGVAYWRWPMLAHPLAWLLAAALPAFALGLHEDLTKAVSPRRRLVATALSGLLAWWLLGAKMAPLGIDWLDSILLLPLVSLCVTMLFVAGLANSVNIIDGMNGLASMCSAIMFAALTYVALQVGDRFVAAMALAGVGSCLGFFVWNYPRGLIFLGDGGAYLLGFWLSALSLLLVARNQEVSPLLPFTLLAYPMFETLFTMYRRKVIRGRPMTLPDGIHLHTLIYRRLMRWALGRDGSMAPTRGNSMTSPYLWVLSGVSVVPATVFWDNSLAMLMACAAFILAYMSLYWRIVTFRTPSWMGRFRHSTQDETPRL